MRVLPSPLPRLISCLMAWFKKTRKPIATPKKDKASRVPEGLWVKCPDCSQAIYNKDLATNLGVCPKCAHHFRITAAERLRMLFDGDWIEYDKDLVSTDPLPLHRHQTVQVAAQGRHRSHRPQRRRDRRLGRDRGHRDDARRDGVRLHRRQHGRGRRRKDHPWHRTRDRRSNTRRHRLLLGRRAHDGRRALADADGENLRRARAARSGDGCPTSPS